MIQSKYPTVYFKHGYAIHSTGIVHSCKGDPGFLLKTEKIWIKK